MKANHSLHRTAAGRLAVVVGARVERSIHRWSPARRRSVSCAFGEEHTMKIPGAAQAVIDTRKLAE